MKQPARIREAVANIGVVKRVLRAAATQAYGELKLGDTQMKIMRYVASHPRVSQATLARATDTDPALVGRALQGLLDRSVLQRERSEEDGRAWLVELGPGGPTLLREVEKASARLVSRITGPLNARDLADFTRIAGKLVAALGAPPDDE